MCALTFPLHSRRQHKTTQHDIGIYDNCLSNAIYFLQNIPTFLLHYYTILTYVCVWNVTDCLVLFTLFAILCHIYTVVSLEDTHIVHETQDI